ncbi:MAG: AAA family ATPase [Gaiellaceae bacterium]
MTELGVIQSELDDLYSELHTLNDEYDREESVLLTLPANDPTEDRLVESLEDRYDQIDSVKAKIRRKKRRRVRVEYADIRHREADRLRALRDLGRLGRRGRRYEHWDPHIQWRPEPGEPCWSTPPSAEQLDEMAGRLQRGRDRELRRLNRMGEHERARESARLRREAEDEMKWEFQDRHGVEITRARWAYEEQINDWCDYWDFPVELRNPIALRDMSESDRHGVLQQRPDAEPDELWDNWNGVWYCLGTEESPLVPEEDALFDDGRALLDRPDELPRYDVPGLVAPGTITVLGGFTGDGKTPLTARLLKTMLTGGEFVGVDVEPVPADYRIVCLTQESSYTFKPLLQSAGLDEVLESGRLQIMYFHVALAAGLTWPEIVKEARDRVGSRGLIIVDPLSDWAMVKSEDDNAIMSEAFRPLLEAIGGGGVSAWVIAHSWKSFRTVPDGDADVMHIRGAGAVVSNASIVVLYKKPKDDAGENIRFFKVARNRFGNQLEPRYVELDTDGILRPVDGLSHVFREMDVADNAVLRVIGGHGSVKQTEIPALTGLSHQRVSDSLHRLAGEGLIHKTGKPRSRKDPVMWHAGLDTNDADPDR